MAFSNEYRLNVDLKRRLSSAIPTFKQGDSAILRFKIYDDGSPFNLTGYTHSEITFRLPSGDTQVGNPKLVGNEIVYEFTGIEMAEVGKVETVLSIMSGKQMVSIPPFACFIFDSMKKGTASYIGLLQELIEEVQRLGLEVKPLIQQLEDTLELTEDKVYELEQFLVQVVTNENTRKSNETTRISNENTRKSNETIRQNNETSRVNAETNRNTNEGIRQSNENLRTSEENTRKSNELTRLSDENQRTSNENTRFTNETTRENNESTRKTNETVRQSNEQQRISAETSRESNEQIRIQQETDRQSSFSNLQTDINNALSDINNVNTNVSSEESIRITNENNRKNTFNTQMQQTTDKIIEMTNLIDELESFDYSPSDTYDFPNLVTYNGSTYIVLQEVTNITPTDDKVNYRLIAQRGVDGTGAVSSVNNVLPDVNGNVDINFTVPLATTTQDGLMSKNFVTKLNSISNGANYIAVEDSLASTSTVDAVSANQAKLLDEKITNHTTGLDGLEHVKVVSELPTDLSGGGIIMKVSTYGLSVPSVHS